MELDFGFEWKKININIKRNEVKRKNVGSLLLFNTTGTCSRRKMLIIEKFNRRRLLVGETFSPQERTSGGKHFKAFVSLSCSWDRILEKGYTYKGIVVEESRRKGKRFTAR